MAFSSISFVFVSHARHARERPDPVGERVERRSRAPVSQEIVQIELGPRRQQRDQRLRIGRREEARSTALPGPSFVRSAATNASKLAMAERRYHSLRGRRCRRRSSGSSPHPGHRPKGGPGSTACTTHAPRSHFASTRGIVQRRSLQRYLRAREQHAFDLPTRLKAGMPQEFDAKYKGTDPNVAMLGMGMVNDIDCTKRSFDAGLRTTRRRG